MPDSGGWQSGGLGCFSGVVKRWAEGDVLYIVLPSRKAHLYHLFALLYISPRVSPMPLPVEFSQLSLSLSLQ